MRSNRLRFQIGLISIVAGINLAPAAGLVEINPPNDPNGDQIIALLNARLIDGNGGAPKENTVVVVKGSKILSVGPTETVTIPDGAKSIDLTGATILPGLIDSHFHSINDLRTPVDYLLANGVTSLRDPGHPFRFYQAVMQTDLDMPRVVNAQLRAMNRLRFVGALK